MKAFVTGGTGFIGGRLIEYLTSLGWVVTGLSRPDSLSKLKDYEGLKVLQGDLGGEIHGLEEALEDCDVVFHSAAIRDRWGISLEEYSRINLKGTRRILEASKGRVGRFVFVSSVGVMGEHGQLGVDESFSTDRFIGKTGYHSTKAAAERLVMEKVGEMEVCMVRPTITYGPGDLDGMLTRLILMIASGKFLRVGRGLNHIHLTFIDDLLEGLYLAATNPKAPGEVFLLAGPESIPVGDLIRLIEINLGRRSRGIFIPEPAARLAALGVETVFQIGKLLWGTNGKLAPIITRDKIDTLCKHHGYSTAKAERLLGYSPSIGYEEGLEITMQWMASVGLLDRVEGLTPSLRSGSKTHG
jgi:nucleoside-diphosphate-sugar epimerase